MHYKICITGLFKRSYKRCLKRGFNGERLSEVLTILSSGGTLPPKYRSHKLSGKYEGCMECHIQPDWLLVWQQNNEQLTLLLIDTGTHSDLFGK